MLLAVMAVAVAMRRDCPARQPSPKKCATSSNATTAFPALAAWINGTASHSVEFDDIFRDAIYHPACPVISAALALAQDRGRGGREFLNAVTVGYEISTRIGVAVQPSHYKYFHTTGTVGVFGGHTTFADPARYWDFRSPGHGDIKFEDIIVALNDVGYTGPLSVEWEDSRMDREHGAAEAAAFVKKIDFKRSNIAFDAQFDR